MIQGFTNQATAAVFMELVDDAAQFSVARELAKDSPAKVTVELRSWASDRASRTQDNFTRSLVDAALREVRWSEIRSALMRD